MTSVVLRRVRNRLRIIIIIIIIIMRQFTLRCLLAQSLTCMPRVRTLISTFEQGYTVSVPCGMMIYVFMMDSTRAKITDGVRAVNSVQKRAFLAMTTSRTCAFNST